MPKAPELPPLSKKPYESKGRRDPFRSLAPIERTPGAIVEDGLTLSVKLVGIVQGRQGLMALVETPDGLGYILRAGDLLGGGTVLEVGSDSVAFSVTRRAGEAPSRVVLRLKAE